MTLGIVIVIVLLAFFILGELVPSYPASTKTPPSTDLRVSESAPDLDAVPSEWERTIIDVKKKVDLRKEALTEYKQVYENAILEIKERRMKEGNPVTKKNPYRS